MYSAVATATGTPITSATPEVISVPTSSGAPWKMVRLTSQSLPKMNDSPKVLNVEPDSPMSRMKKKTISARMSTAREVNPHARH